MDLAFNNYFNQSFIFLSGRIGVYIFTMAHSQALQFLRISSNYLKKK
jgi:hypothetical protein